MRNALAIVTLALGIGASTAIFSFLNPLVLHPLTFPHANRLVTVESRDLKGNPAPVSYPDFRDWSAQKSALADLAAFDIGFFELTGVNEAKKIPGGAGKLGESISDAQRGTGLLGRDFSR